MIAISPRADFARAHDSVHSLAVLYVAPARAGLEQPRRAFVAHRPPPVPTSAAFQDTDFFTFQDTESWTFPEHRVLTFPAHRVLAFQDTKFDYPASQTSRKPDMAQVSRAPSISPASAARSGSWARAAWRRRCCS